MMKPIYLDNHAATPADPRVIEAMLPFFGEVFGNAASRNHPFGWRAKEAVEAARKQVAELIGTSPREIVFTSGATESNNLAIKGVAEARGGGRIVTVATEHRAVLDPCRRLERQGFRITYLPVAGDGLLDLDQLRKALDDQTILISVMYANNEIGVLQPIAAIGRIARERGIPFHVDAAQAVGKVPIDVDADGIDLLSISGHKIYGPKGAGALFVRRRDARVELAPQMDGGGHERGLRSGTLNVPGIVGLGKACAVCAEEMRAEAARTRALRDRLKEILCERLDDIEVNGALEPRLPNNLNVRFGGVDGEALLMGLDDVAVSSGSACTSNEPEPSHVLRALGVSERLSQASIRFGIGRFTTPEEIAYAAEKVVRVVQRLRALAA